AKLSSETQLVRTRVDEEHGGFMLEIDDRSAGYPRVSVAGATFVESPEYRTLLNSYRDVADIGGRMVIAHVSRGQEEPEDVDVEVDLAAGADAAGAPPAPDAGADAPTAARRPRRDADHHVSSISELVD